MCMHMRTSIYDKENENNRLWESDGVLVSQVGTRDGPSADVIVWYQDLYEE